MSWTPEVLVPARDAALARIDGGSAAGPASMRIYTSDGSLLVSLPLDEPAGAVDSVTGAFTLYPGAPQYATGSGLAGYADLVDSAGVLLYGALPVTQGGAPQAGHAVLSATTIVEGSEVTLMSASVGS